MKTAIAAVGLLLGLFIAFSVPAAPQNPTPHPPALEDKLYELLKRVQVAAPPPGVTETAEELDERLHGIARDAALAAAGDARDALLVLAVAHHESKFAVDVDRGPCRPKTCPDHAACMLQIVTGDVRRRRLLFADRRFCFETGLAALKHSRLAECPEAELQFVTYAGGSCEKGAQGSRELYEYWMKWIAGYEALEREAA